MTDFAKARIDMIEGQLRPSGVFDARVLAAVGQVPRERFVPQDQRQFAYLDKEHDLAGASGRRMGAPAQVAKLIELAGVGEDDIVLDVGCGSGYSTAVLAHLANAVVAIEEDGELVDRANEILADLDISNAAVIKGPLKKGAPGEAPFDVIVIEGAVDEVPAALFDQLRVGGRLVAIVGQGADATAVTYVRSEHSLDSFPAFNAILPPLAEMTKAPGFRF